MIYDFNPFEPNGFTTYVMNSDELVDKMMEKYKFYRGVWEEDADKAFVHAEDDLGINVRYDLTSSDRITLFKLIDEYEEMD